MRTECIDISELSDSREIMQQKSPKSMRIFILIVTVLLVMAVIWSLFGKIDTYIRVNGEIRAEGTDSSLISLSDSQIRRMNFEDGDIVNKGDVIIEFDSSYYMEQKVLLENQRDNNNVEIEQYRKLINSIQKDKNLFDLSTESKFYYEYENYACEFKSYEEQIALDDNQKTLSIKKLEQDIFNNQNSFDSASLLIDEYQKLYDAVKSDNEYLGKEQNVLQAYNSYCESLRKTQVVYQQHLLSYNELLQQGNATDNQIKQAALSTSAAESDVKLVKISMLTNITEIITELEQQKINYRNSLEKLNMEKTALLLNNSSTNAKEKTKISYYININNAIATKEQENVSLNSQINDFERKISQCQIVATQTGTLVLYTNYTLGDFISVGSLIATIIPDSENLSAVLYIPEYSISDVNLGQEVEYEFDAISSIDFGKTHGKVTEISSDSFMDESSGQKYFKAKATIDNSVLTNNEGKKKILRIGMLTEAHAITGKQTIFNWLLDKLDFI